VSNINLMLPIVYLPFSIIYLLFSTMSLLTAASMVGGNPTGPSAPAVRMARPGRTHGSRTA
jgi:hypothetical protein